MIASIVSLQLLWALLALANHQIDHAAIQAQERELAKKWGRPSSFAGLVTFAHLPYTQCLNSLRHRYDVAVIGAPFDTGTTYRSGARFGPRAIRQASMRQTAYRGFNARAAINPYRSWARVLDCGDIPVTPLDNQVAMRQMSEAYAELGSRVPAFDADKASQHIDEEYAEYPKLVTLGGDHSVALPALRALHELYQKPIAVVHFDAHCDANYNHASVFWNAAQEGLLANGSCIHAGLRSRLTGTGFQDYENDVQQGFMQIEVDDIDRWGAEGIAEKIIARVGTEIPVYLSIDIDVLDVAFAPATGTPEAGGWSTRELIRILRGIEGLNVVGADIVEVAPAYDSVGEPTSIAAAQIVYEVLTSIVKRGLTAVANALVDDEQAEEQFCSGCEK
ncbi:agmatinase, mitochondrial precursor [Aureobasidium melanogenum CBS 110374]|uniref:Agmatinase, mitochondrial n=1 Tax=Aureobasidium melanogenum (strain CBS 110374) TaxID=1043003 RepID=A0A074W017_AURM1|nr:agmatinase, mitochondrial precursor [Aureobasidium melanogenum CBS 110374]KEQ66098.1 agmatinase, mitochondrial precursor [Aureobasidium melanogenum CBS 110374]